MGEYNRASVTVANIVFTERQHVKVLAIRDNSQRYTIIRRGEVPSNYLFSYPLSYIPHISTQQLIERISRQFRPEPIIPDRDSLSEYINHTFSSHQPRINPLSQEVVESLVETKLNENDPCLEDKCPICLDKFIIGEKVIVLKCKHVTHSTCLRRWFNEHNTCPQCRFIPKL